MENRVLDVAISNLVINHQQYANVIFEYSFQFQRLSSLFVFQDSPTAYAVVR